MKAETPDLLSRSSLRTSSATGGSAINSAKYFVVTGELKDY